MKRLLLLLIAGLANLAHAELKVEPIPNVEVLSLPYKPSYIYAHDANFHSLVDGKVVLVDVAADTQEYKGAIGAAQMATFAAASKRDELYVAESFYSRGTRGDRTDVITIYDKANLAKQAEILLPNRNRAQIVTNKYALQLIDNEKFLLVLGFTPASSVIVVDIEQRKIISEVPIPGCNMVYPTGSRGFSALCGDGSMLTVALNKQGEEKKRFITPPFFSVDDDPVFDKPVYINGVAYFVSYQSKVYPVDMNATKPKVLPSWNLTSQEEQSANWRPGGWQILSADAEGHLYVIMHKDGYNGSHKFGGEEVWVFDSHTKQRLRKLSMQTNAFSIQMTNQKVPLLAVTNTDMGLDVYTETGELQRSISISDTAMPLILHAEGS